MYIKLYIYIQLLGSRQCRLPSRTRTRSVQSPPGLKPLHITLGIFSFFTAGETRGPPSTSVRTGRGKYRGYRQVSSAMAARWLLDDTFVRDLLRNFNGGTNERTNAHPLGRSRAGVFVSLVHVGADSRDVSFPAIGKP